MIVEFGTSNDAFRLEDGTVDREEVALALIRVAQLVRTGRDSGTVYDVNGNNVGAFAVRGGDPR